MGGIVRLWRWIMAVAAGALVSVAALHLSGEAMPWPGLAGLFRTANPAEVALRKQLAELAGRAKATESSEDLAAATAFYNGHGGRLLWVTESGLTERGSAVLGEIQKADDWGLRARDFAVPQPAAASLSPQAAATAEMALTFAVLKYARYARGGRFGDPARISKVVDYKPPLLRSADVLAAIAASDAPDAYLRSLHPQHAQFEALRRMLLKLRGSSAPTSAEPGQEREGTETSIRKARILVNMERWRWLPAELGAFHVWNNVPEFMTRVVRSGKTIHTDR
ncbi:MAG TPA: hypothetical protein VFY92_09380, partial [Hyphomicrobiaceae bacterium]|nr:hypothetical protein [Hyphomicrobiaceae bacterium]